MTFIPDGEPCAYVASLLPADVRSGAVGWLDAEHPYSKGSADPKFVQALFEACRSNTALWSPGFHDCELCIAAGDEPRRVASHGGEKISVGLAVLFAVGRDGAWLIAPNMVIHYVMDHGYAPPEEFVEAVLARRFEDGEKFVLPPDARR